MNAPVALQEIEREHGVDLIDDAGARRRLHDHVETAKRHLSTRTHATIDIDGLPGLQEFHTSITRAWCEDVCAGHFRRSVQLVQECLRDAGLAPAEIDDVVLVGGSSRIPKIQSLLRQVFPGKALNMSVNPDEAIAHGAAVRASMLAESCPKQLQRVRLQDVIPLSLGIGLDNDQVAVLLRRNTRIPTTVTRRNFAMPTNDCTGVSIPVFEGESMAASKNNLLGEFALLGLPACGTASRQVEVSFSIDANGILSIKATHRGSGQWRQIRADYRNGSLTSEDVQRMKKEAEQGQPVAAAEVSPV